MPGTGCPDGLHYDVKGNLWIAAPRLGGVLQVDPRGLTVGFVPVPGTDLATTNFAFGGQDNRDIVVMAANSGIFYRFKAPHPGLIGPAGTRLPAQP
jgi:gluconolactonase